MNTAITDTTPTPNVPDSDFGDTSRVPPLGLTDTESDSRSPRMPLSIPRDQAYYWSTAWQKDIREALDALRRGDFEDFDSRDDPNDVARWLLNDD